MFFTDGCPILTHCADAPEPAEVRLPVLAEPYGRVKSALGVRHAGGGRLHHLLACRLQGLLKTCRKHRLTAMDHVKQDRKVSGSR